MSNEKSTRTRAIYITFPSSPKRGVIRYISSIFNKCNFDEKEIIYIENFSLSTRIMDIIKNLKRKTDKNAINIIFIPSAPLYDSLGPIIFKIFSRSKNVKLISPIFHLNPLSLRENRYDKFSFIFSVMQRTGAFLEILFGDIFLTENTYIEKYIYKYRRNAKVIVKQLGISKEYIPELAQILNCNKDIDFLYVGGLDKLKGIVDILKAFKPISKSHSLVIAGYGNKEYIEKIIKKENIYNVEVYSNISEEEKFKLYSRAKVYVFPSLADGIPITFHEAWAYGNLVVTYMLPTYIDIRDRIFSVPPLDIEKLREKMIFALSNYDKYKDLIISNYWYAVKNSNDDGNIQEICDKIYSYLDLTR